MPPNNDRRDQVAAALSDYIARYGVAAADDGRRIQAFLRDMVPDGGGAIVAVVMAASQGVPSAVASAGDATVISRKSLENMLMSECALSSDAAEWAVSVWADALQEDSSSSLAASDSGADGQPGRAFSPVDVGSSSRSAKRDAEPELRSKEKAEREPASGQAATNPAPQAPTLAQESGTNEAVPADTAKRRTSTTAVVVVAIVVIILGLVWWGVSRSRAPEQTGAATSNDPGSVASAFLAAMKSGDVQTAGSYTTLDMTNSSALLPASFDSSDLSVDDSSGSPVVSVGPQGDGAASLQMTVEGGQVVSIVYKKSMTENKTYTAAPVYDDRRDLPIGFALPESDGTPGAKEVVTSLKIANGVQESSEGPSVTENIVTEAEAPTIARGIGRPSTAVRVTDLRFGTDVSNYRVTNPVKTVSLRQLKGRKTYLTHVLSSVRSRVKFGTAIFLPQGTDDTPLKGSTVASSGKWSSTYPTGYLTDPGWYAAVVYAGGKPTAAIKIHVTK